MCIRDSRQNACPQRGNQNNRNNQNRRGNQGRNYNNRNNQPQASQGLVFIGACGVARGGCGGRALVLWVPVSL